MRNKVVHGWHVSPLLDSDEMFHRRKSLLDTAGSQELLHSHGVPQEDGDQLVVGQGELDVFVRLDVHPGALQRPPARGGVGPGQHGGSPLGGPATSQEVVEQAGTAGTDVGVQGGDREDAQSVEGALGGSGDLGENPLHHISQISHQVTGRQTMRNGPAFCGDHPDMSGVSLSPG